MSVGQVNPHRVTVALDRAGLFGPSADARLGAVEPDLDDWEAGRSQPTAAQLARLARLANVQPGFFALTDDQAPQLIVAFVCGRGSRGGLVVTMRGEPADAPLQPMFVIGDGG